MLLYSGIIIQMEQQMKHSRSLSTERISTMWKKLLNIFRRPAPELHRIPPRPVRCYQPELPFDM